MADLAWENEVPCESRKFGRFGGFGNALALIGPIAEDAAPKWKRMGTYAAEKVTAAICRNGPKGAKHKW
jgi:hypothetical protein